MAECLFLTHLPAEIRVNIYRNLLSFRKPLELRQWQQGSQDASILRANRQIYQEALPVLYDRNTIVVSRNDFCLDTDPDLQTPMRRDRVRHLLVRNFSSSIRCSPLASHDDEWNTCCKVCQPSATGFIATLATLPKIQSVTIDYRHQPKEFRFIKDTIRGIGSTSVDAEHGFSLTCTDIAQYQLTSSSIPSTLTIHFTNFAFNTIWNEFSSLSSSTSVFGIGSAESEILKRLREEVDRHLTDKLYLLHCARQSAFFDRFFLRLPGIWAAMDTAKSAGKDASKEMEALTEEVRHFCERYTVNTWMQLILLSHKEAELRDFPVK